jgi:arylsulfatase A-like enzyme
MPPPREIERVIVAVLDGLRPDAIPLYNLRHIDRLSREGAATFAGTTVDPSVTAAAMTSLLTGAPPQIHGLTSERFHIPKPRGPLDPLPQLLGRAGLPSTACLASLPRAYRGLGQRIAAKLGFTATRFVGDSAAEILMAGRDVIRDQRRGLILFHWPDADRAGHAHGWMSNEYGAAARRLDAALGVLAAVANATTDRSTVLIALADHGGGGLCRTHHDSAHRHDRTIPILVIGGAVHPGRLAPSASLLDVPPTVAWALRVTPPPSYAGRPLVEAFATPREPVLARLAAACA